ncbi:MAG: beta-ketoacyl-[acyl-carrier-protein] synthase II [Lentisphaerae bacterium]|nr:beta-ketoacyl-[acyl-carrier-protein] synthase II [Lentisphaerota bacterium]
MEYRRVAVTGIGAISCLGNSVKETWDALLAGKCGIDTIKRFDMSAYRTHIAGEVKNFDITKYMSDKEARRLDDFCHYAIAATDEALADAGLPLDFRLEGSPVDPERVGVCVGSGIGGMRTMEEQCIKLIQSGPSRVSPFLIPMMIIDMASGSVSMRVGAKGPNFAAVTACATASHSIGEAYCAVSRGDADIMITGGAEASVSRLGIGGFCAMKALSTRNDDPQHASRPFDKDRDGFVMSEGAGVLILEEMEHAKKRGAKIYGEIIGYGATGDAFHITSPAPGGEGGARAMKMAMKNAGINPEDVDYINAHGTSTHLNDMYETAAIKTAFGDAARKVAISSTKGGMGHSLGAAGGLETIVCLKAMETGIVPQTLNYTTPDPDCDLDYTPNTPRERQINIAVNTNLGFGGHNGVIIVKKV